MGHHVQSQCLGGWRDCWECEFQASLLLEWRGWGSVSDQTLGIVSVTIKAIWEETVGKDMHTQILCFIKSDLPDSPKAYFIQWVSNWRSEVKHGGTHPIVSLGALRQEGYDVKPSLRAIVMWDPGTKPTTDTPPLHSEYLFSICVDTVKTWCHRTRKNF